MDGRKAAFLISTNNSQRHLKAMTSPSLRVWNSSILKTRVKRGLRNMTEVYNPLFKTDPVYALIQHITQKYYSPEIFHRTEKRGSQIRENITLGRSSLGQCC